MRYEIVGKKTKLFGKTLWEIVGNLKNFGVGRYVRLSYTVRNPKLNFFKIIKVQPVPPPKNQFENRNVMIWIDEVWKDRLMGTKCTLHNNDKAQFQLISKIEEKVLLEKLKNTKPPVVNLKKYCTWPPLYKTLWEKDSADTGKYGPIPELKSVKRDLIGCNVIENEKKIAPISCNLNKGELTVDELYKEIVRLKLFIKNNSSA